MWRSVINFFTPIKYPGDDNKTRAAQSVHWISLAFMLAVLLYIVGSKAFSTAFTLNIFDLILLIIFLGLAILWYLGRAGFVFQAGTILTVFLWLAINAVAYSGFGVRDSAFLGNFIILLAAGLLIGWRGAVALSALTIVVGFAFAYAEVNGISRAFDYFTSPYTTIQAMSVVFGIFAVLIYFLISGLEGAISRSQANARELESTNRDLTSVQSKLEENQTALLAANEQLKRRADRISAIAAIAKTITVVQEIGSLLPVVVEAVSDRFKFQHVGIYLLEESGRSAVLSAASSDEGRQSQLGGTRIKVGSETLVGFVTERGEPRVGHPTGKTSQGFEHTEARSLLALPLKTRELVIGALDIQSHQENAFTQEDVSTLQILADQIAIAIQNSRSAERAQGALLKAEIASRQLIGKGWKDIVGSTDTRGYRYDGIRLEALKEATKPVHSANSLIVPVRLRGQVIGRLKINPADHTRQLTEDEIAMIEATAERVALALESSRLLEEAQNRAQRETFLGELSTKLGASYQLDSILRDTVEELGQSLRTTTVSFQLVSPSATLPDNGNHPADRLD